MKALFTFFLIVTVFSVSAQDGVIVKYFDSTFFPCTKENAFYSTKLIKEDSAYKCTILYADSNKLYSITSYKDTFLVTGVGTMVTHYKSGKIKDSIIFNDDGTEKLIIDYYESGKLKDSSFRVALTMEYESYYYYESGKLKGHSYWDNTLKKNVDESFDEKGELLKNYIHSKEASFPDGRNGWVEFLTKNLRTNVPIKHKAPLGRYTVYISLSINKDGRVNDVIAENNPGYGTMEEAIRAIKKSPKWEAAIEDNKPIAYHARQKITFVVQED